MNKKYIAPSVLVMDINNLRIMEVSDPTKPQTINVGNNSDEHDHSASSKFFNFGFGDID